MLDPKRLGLAGGILWGVSIFILTLISVGTGYAHEWLSSIASIYPGYSISVGGSFIGLVIGFIDGFLCLAILAWLYNFLGKYCKDSCCDSPDGKGGCCH